MGDRGQLAGGHGGAGGCRAQLGSVTSSSCTTSEKQGKRGGDTISRGWEKRGEE